MELLRIGPALEGKQIDRLQAVCARREAARVEAALTARRADAATDRNLMPSLLDANGDRGRDRGALQTVFGAYTETPVF